MAGLVECGRSGGRVGGEWRAWAIAAAILFVGLGASRVASAAPGVVVVGGTIADDQRALVTAAVTDVVGELGWTAPSTALSKTDRDALLGCQNSVEPWTCVPRALAASGVHRTLVIHTEAKAGDGNTRIVVLSGQLVVTSPEGSVVRQKFCEHCSDDQLTQAARELAQQLLREYAVRQGRTVLAVRSEPPGAEVTLDGQRVGATNASLRTYPGTHVLVVEKPGYATETREVTVEDGATAEVMVALRAADGAAGPSGPALGTPRTMPSRLVPALVIGAGVVALGAGLALQVTKDSPPLGEEQPARLYSGPGIGLAIGGAALTGLGTWLWLRAGRARDTAAQPATTAAPATPVSAPAISLVDGGGVLGWAGAF